MEKINIHNYEAYLLDFSEGNLTDEQQLALELFLIQHPELDVNLDDLSDICLDNEFVSFSNKTALKKSENDLVSEAQFIAYIEHQLPKNERLEIEKNCANNQYLLHELELYSKTIARADKSIVFASKSSLKRKSKIIWFNFSAAQFSAAASIVFLIGLMILWPKTDNTTDLTLANHVNTPKAVLLQSEHKKDSSSQNKNDIPVLKENQKILAQSHHSSATQQKKSPLNHSKSEKELMTVVSTSDSEIAPINNSPIESLKSEVLVAQNLPDPIKQQTIVHVIIENENETLESNTPISKTGIWAIASRTLKNLNVMGVKGVNGSEETVNENAAYALSFGGVSITHKAGKL